MSDRAKQLLEQVRALPQEERDGLLDELWEEYEQAPPDPYPDEEAWRAELDRRLGAVADGTAVLFDADLVFREARDRLRKNHS
jgi:putative addiction module component (TIGR02574 family)